MRRLKKDFYIQWAVYIALLASLPACYEPVEGCLNPRATNFDLDADEACIDNCCEFPELELKFTHVWDYGDTIIRLRQDTFYLDEGGNPFRIEQVRFYGSEWRLNTLASGSLEVMDSITLKVFDGGVDTSSITVVDDFVLANSRSSATIKLGGVEPTGLLTSLNWRFGVNNEVNRTFAATVPNNHPLEPQEGNLNYGPESGYVFAQFTLFRDTAATDTIPLVVNVFGDADSQTLNLPLETPTAFIEGFSPTLTIQVNYAAWLEGANIRTGDTTTLKSIFVENLTNAFELIDLSN